METQAARANLLPARLSLRLALMRIFSALEAGNRKRGRLDHRLARVDRDVIVALILNPDDRTAYLSRQDLRRL